MQEIEKTLEKQKEIVKDDDRHHHHLENLSDTHHSIHGEKYKKHDNEKKNTIDYVPTNLLPLGGLR